MAKLNKNNFSEWYNEIIKEAEIIDLRYNVKGFIVYRPWGMFVLKKMYSMYEKVLEENGHMPVHFPAVIPIEYFKKEEEHIKGFEGEVFWITRAGLNELAKEEIVVLRPTSETAIYPMFSLWINGAKDLPLKVYQSGTVWRYETKATRPLIRGREILWIETHCAFNNEKNARNQIKQDIEIAERVVKHIFGIPFIFFRRPEWDKFAGAEETYAADTLMPDSRVLQILTTHLLGNNFSKPFNIMFLDVDGKKKYVWQTTCGPGMQRFLAAMISWHGDEKGLFFPLDLSPIQIVIVPIFVKENKESIFHYAKSIEHKLKALGYRAYADLTEDESPGFKFNKWELKGVPIRIELGQKEMESNTITYVLRKSNEKRKTSIDNISVVFEEYRKHFEHIIKENIDALNKNIREAKTFDEIEKHLEKGIVRVPFCSIGNDGKECYKEIKEKLQAEVRGERADIKESPVHNEKCIICGREAKVFAYIAKQY
ncbi:MAG: proline--tRNA ligase [Candidatus Anstonellales archaeon]